MERIDCDVLVVGGGLAGLWGLLHLPDDLDVLVVDPGRGGGSSPWAQGGMAVAVGPQDSPELHVADTLRAGAGACTVPAVEVLAHEAPLALDELIRLGCRFDRTPDGDLDLNHEAAQSVARSVHAADATGREIMRVVGARAGDRARVLRGTVTELPVTDGRCTGARVGTPDGTAVVSFRGALLATGGCGALYAATTNPPGSTGDGIALAYSAGAAVGDLEFVQFHPTALAVRGHRRLLLTEALRGEGAAIVDTDGRRFLADHHPDAELAPRDVVARAIAERPEVFLDARPLGGLLERRFPNVVAAVREAGFDMAVEPVPVAPAAHYSLGGVVTDTDGRTSVPGLYAAGECATVGLHGANRMAGNSLTEAVVFGRRAALTLARELGDRPGPLPEAAAVADPDVSLARLREAMMSDAGLVRTEESLTRALGVATEPGLGLPGLTAQLICRSALMRTESRGVHFRADAPERKDAWDGVHLTLRSYT